MKCIFFLVCLFSTPELYAQSPLPIIRATSRSVSINDGGVYDKDAWSLNPKLRPDVYTADRSRKTKWVTFYTDIDSIKIKLHPGKKVGFIILLNGKDSCYTEIASAIPPEDKAQIATTDTIAFTVTPYNAIAFKAVINEKDTINLHFDLGSWDFRLTKEAVHTRTSLLPATKLQLGSMIFLNPTVGTTDRTSTGMDGRFGWNLFEGKQVELNYDRNIMIVRSGQRLKVPGGYRRSTIEFRRSFMIVKGIMKKGNLKFPADFLLDTGADQAIILDSTWTAANDYAANLNRITTITLHDPRGQKFETRVVLAPGFEINGLALADIPTLILGSRNPVGFPINYLGNDLLKRFNIIMDFKHDRIYWTPNSLSRTAFRTNS